MLTNQHSCGPYSPTRAYYETATPRDTGCVFAASVDAAGVAREERDALHNAWDTENNLVFSTHVNRESRSGHNDDELHTVLSAPVGVAAEKGW